MRSSWRTPLLVGGVLLGASCTDGSGGNSPPPPPPPPNPLTDEYDITWASHRDGNWEIYRMTADGSVVANLTNNQAQDLYPANNPFDTMIAFSSDRDGHPQIYVDEFRLGLVRRVTNGPASDYAPTWSPDGKKIAFTREVTPGHQQIFVMNQDGTGQVNISNTTHNDDEASWSRTLNKIVFASDRDAIYGPNTYLEIYTMNPDGSGVTRLTFNDTGIDYLPSWTPDGRILFTTNRTTNPQCYTFALDIWIMNADGSNQQNVTNDCHGDAGGSYNGTDMVFMSDRADTVKYAWDLYKMKLSGGPVTRLTTTKNESQPAWR